jgi:amidohydrolase
MASPRPIPDALTRRLAEWRRDRHAHPETAFEERGTARAFAEWCAHAGATRVHTGIGGTGVVARFDAGTEGPTLLFRAELDALPIAEGGGERPHRSRVEGKGHLCGHDGHLSLLAGLAALLGERPPARGRVYLLAQPAEETGAGAAAVLDDRRWSGLAPDACYAVHNLPGFPLGQVQCRPGAVTAAVHSLAIRWKGHTAHAAEPEGGRHPAGALRRALGRLGEARQPDAAREDFRLAVPVFARMGEADPDPAYGTAAGSAELHATLRCWRQDALEAFSGHLEAALRADAEDEGLELSIERREAFAACDNDGELAGSVREAARAAGLPLHEDPPRFRWGEDFGLFTQRHRGVLIGLGSGEEHPALHHPDYDFPDDLIAPGLRLYAALLDGHGL